MSPKYHLAINEMYFIPKHGSIDNNILNYVMTHYIVSELVCREDFFNNSYNGSTL